MKHYVKLLTLCSTGTLLGCAQISQAPTLGEPVVVSAARVPMVSRAQPVGNLAGPVSDVEGLFILGRAAHDAGQLILAEERFDQVLRKQPLHLGALNSIAVVYAQTDRIDLALQFFKRALQLDPRASHVHNNFGYVLLQSGQLVEAESELAQARDLNPSNVQTRQNIERLEQTKARSNALTALAALVTPAEAVPAGPRLVAVGPQVYELRDQTSSVSAATQVRPATALQTEQPAASPVGARVAPASAIGLALRGLRIEVSNGVGIRYLARRTAQRLAPLGVVTARLTNQASYRQWKTEIQFNSGQKDAAAALATQLPVAVRTVAAARLNSNYQMRLVLGHDLKGDAMAAWLEAGTEAELALTGEAPWRWS